MAPSPSEQGLLDEFVIVTGISLDDADSVEKATQLLAHHNNNLNNAVLAYFDTGFDLPAAHTPPPILPDEPLFASGSEPHTTEVLHRNLQIDFALESLLPQLPKAPRISKKWQFDLGIHVSRKSFQSLDPEKTSPQQDTPAKLPFFWIVLLIIPRCLGFLWSSLRHLLGMNLRPVYHTKLNFKFNYDNYDEKYKLLESCGDQLNVAPYQVTTSGFNECYDECQQNHYFLLVLLVDDQSTLFLLQLLGSSIVKGMFDKLKGEYKETRVYLGNVDRCPEACEVARTYRVRNTPSVVLIGNVSRNPAVMASMSIIYKTSLHWGDVDLEAHGLKKVMRGLQVNLSDFNPQLVAKRFDKQEMEFSRMIREKQDEAFQESLKSDRVKREEKENMLKQAEYQLRESAVRYGFIAHLAESEYFEKQVAGLALLDYVRIAIKMPDGRRLVQKFLKSASLCELYLFVESQMAVEAETVEHEDMSIKDFLARFSFSFQLFKPLPKVSVPVSATSIAEFGQLMSGDNLLFEYNDEYAEAEQTVQAPE